MESIQPAFVSVAHFAISSLISLVALDQPYRYRIVLGPFLLLFAMLSFRNLKYIPFGMSLSSLWGLFITIYVAHISAVLYIENWTLSPLENLISDVPITQNEKQALISWKLKAAYKIWSSPRWLPPLPAANITNEDSDTNYARIISGGPEQSSINANTKHHPTTEAAFILSRVTKLCAIVLTYHLIATHVFPGHFRPMVIDDFSPHRERYLSRLLCGPSAAASSSGVGPIHLRETLLRAALAVDWVVVAYLVLEGCHHLSALLFVCVLRLDSPDEWPPFFGSLTRITSVRGFWGGFWHQLVVGPYGTHAKVVSRRIFGLQPRSRADKTLVTFCIFFFSGLAHAAVSWQMGRRCGVFRDLAWFVANFGAGGIELLVQRQSAVLMKRLGLSSSYRFFVPSLWVKSLGFFWVFVFFFWSVPKWQFPKIYCATLIEIYNR